MFAHEAHDPRAIAPSCSPKMKPRNAKLRHGPHDDSGYACDHSDCSSPEHVDELSDLRKALKMCEGAATPRTPRMPDARDFESVADFMSVTQRRTRHRRVIEEWMATEARQ